MDFGLDSIRELLEGFLKNSGGRRGREREQRRQEAAGDAPAGAAGTGVGAPGAGTGTAGGADGAGATAEPAESGGAVDGTTLESGVGAEAGAAGQAEPTAGTGVTRDERPDPGELDDDEAVDELFHRLESLEDELDQKDSTLGSIRDSQEHVADQVEDVNDTIRQLLGIYDQLTNDVNPFTGDGESDGGFDVFGADGGEAEDDGFGLEAAATAEADREAADPDDETVSFDDLKEAIEEAADEREETDGHAITFDEEDIDDGDAESEGDGESVDDDTRVEVTATESVDEDDESDEGDDDVTLDRLANSYASDVIVFEWLTDLVRTAGPSATLRAISYYHEIGWIEEDVKEHLEAVLSGPDLDIHVDPAATPTELTAEDHADSYTYIMKLHEIHDAKGEVGS